jgi:hypothetical protein
VGDILRPFCHIRLRDRFLLTSQAVPKPYITDIVRESLETLKYM